MKPPASGGNRAGIGMTSARTRERLIQRLRDQGIVNPRVLEQIRNVPRHLFVDEALATRAYEDTALPIGHGTDHFAALHRGAHDGGAARERADARQGARDRHGLRLSERPCCRRWCVFVYSIERISALLDRARARFKELGVRNVHLRHGDGFQGWAAHAPYDAILMAAAPLAIPDVLFDQLAQGGRLIAPVGAEGRQQLVRITRRGDDLHTEKLGHGEFRPVAERNDCSG